MPEFTWEESDNYMYIQELQAKSDGALIKEYFDLLRTRKEGDRNRFLSTMISYCTTELENRGLIDASGKIDSKKARERKKEGKDHHE